MIEMGRLLETGEAANPHRAATVVVAQNTQLSKHSLEDSVIRRLTNAFNEDEELYRRLGREKIVDDPAREEL